MEDHQLKREEKEEETRQGGEGEGEEEEEFRPAEEVFHDPSELDFLMQHGGASTDGIALARQSLFVKFDPLVGGRASLFPQANGQQPAESSGTRPFILSFSLVFFLVKLGKTQ